MTTSPIPHTFQHDPKALTLALWQIPGFSANHFKILKARFSRQEILTLPLHQLAKHIPTAFLKGEPLAQKIQWASVEKAFNWAAQPQHHLMDENDKNYPPLLKEIHDAPPILYVKGQVNCLLNPQLAMVGSRKATYQGLENAKQFAKGLSEHGLTITSGMALGVDGASHQGALLGTGSTLGVMGAGFHHLYPKAHAKLAEKIIEKGALISEFPLDVPVARHHFPRRNRLISGMSLGVLVVEAALKSGSLITARCALEQNREIFAIPGSIHNKQAEGCHALIKEGAALVTSVADLLDGLPAFASNPHNHQNIEKTSEISEILPITLDPPLTKLVKCVDYELTPLNTICVRANLPVAQTAAQLTQLELKGMILAVPGGYVRKVKKVREPHE